MRKAIDIILTLNLLFLTGFVLYVWWNGSLIVRYDPESVAADQAVYDSLAHLFSETLREGVDERVGVPIEGYEPSMLIAAYPGLVETDFEDVEASIGKYVVVDGTLVHVTPPGALLHSAASAIGRNGYATLLKNLATRLHIDLSEDGTLTQVMIAIEE